MSSIDLTDCISNVILSFNILNPYGHMAIMMPVGSLKKVGKVASLFRFDRSKVERQTTVHDMLYAGRKVYLSWCPLGVSEGDL